MKEELVQRGLTEKQVTIIEQYLDISGSTPEILSRLMSLVGDHEPGKNGIKELEYVISSFQNIAPSSELISYGDLRYFLGYSGISFICSLLQFLNYKMDFWIINYFYGNANLGIYSLSATLAQLVWILPQSIALILFPMSSYMEKDELLEVTNKLCRVSVFIVLLILPFAAVCALFIPELFGEDFRNSIGLFYFFLIGTVPYILIKIIASVFAGTGKVMYNFYASFFGFRFPA